VVRSGSVTRGAFRVCNAWCVQALVCDAWCVQALWRVVRSGSVVRLGSVTRGVVRSGSVMRCAFRRGAFRLCNAWCVQ
ncbi:hypothetical protein KUCAC02_035410, partial [Chaenocephalus aceratus]